MTTFPIGKYRCYSLDTPVESAVAIFEQLYRRPPEKIFTHARMLWLGPINHYDTELIAKSIKALEEETP